MTSTMPSDRMCCPANTGRKNRQVSGCKPGIHGRLPGPAITAGLLLFFVFPVQGQMFSYEREDQSTVQSISVAYQLMDFELVEGVGAGAVFDNPTIGLYYFRPNFAANMNYGRYTGTFTLEDPDIRLLEASIFIWSGLELLSLGSVGRLEIPLIAHSGYRSMEQRFELQSNETFNLAVIGLGTGLGMASPGNAAVSYEIRATPILGLATRSFEGQAGYARLLDVDAQVHLTRLVGRIGIALGYNFRIQDWNVESSRLVPGQPVMEQRYRSSQNMLRVGVSW